MSILTKIAQWFTQKKIENAQPVSKRHTFLNVAVGSSLSVDDTLLSIHKDQLMLDVPFDLLSSLSVKNVSEQTVYNERRHVLLMNERMPETSFDIYIETIDDIRSVTLWCVVDEFYPKAPSEWAETLAELMEDQINVADNDLSRSHYIETMGNLLVDGAGHTPHIAHESVYYRDVPQLNGRELFKKVVIDKNKLQVAIGYELNPAQITVNY